MIFVFVSILLPKVDFFVAIGCFEFIKLCFSVKSHQFLEICFVKMIIAFFTHFLFWKVNSKEVLFESSTRSHFNFIKIAFIRFKLLYLHLFNVIDTIINCFRSIMICFEPWASLCVLKVVNSHFATELHQIITSITTSWMFKSWNPPQKMNPTLCKSLLVDLIFRSIPVWDS